MLRPNFSYTRALPDNNIATENTCDRVNLLDDDSDDPPELQAATFPGPGPPGRTRLATLVYRVHDDLARVVDCDKAAIGRERSLPRDAFRRDRAGAEVRRRQESHLVLKAMLLEKVGHVPRVDPQHLGGPLADSVGAHERVEQDLPLGEQEPFTQVQIG
jgi:hypothetical protein